MLFITALVTFITGSQAQSISDLLEPFAQALNSTHHSIQHQFDNDLSNTGCEYYTACPDTHNGSWTGDQGDPPGLKLIDSFGQVPVNPDTSIVKIPQDLDPNDATIRDICTIKDEDSWYSNSELEGISWQYVATDDSITVFYPASEWGSCDYDPKERPWWVSAVTAQRDIAILIDTTSDQLEDMKETAMKIISAMSYWDYFCIVEYTDSSTGCNLVRALPSNIANAQEHIFSISGDNVAQTNIGKAIQKTLEGMDASIETGDTSLCHKTVIVLSGGSSNLHEPHPEDAIDDESVILFAGIFGDSNSKGAIYDLSRAACTNGGVAEYVEDPDTFVKNIGAFYESKADNSATIRWSYPYEDALGQGWMITGSIPVYETDEDTRYVKAVVSIDLLIDNIFNNQTVTEIANSLLELQVCPHIDLETKSMAQLSACDYGINDEENGQAKVEKLKPLIVIITVLLCLFVIIYPAVVLFNKGREYEGGAICWLAVIAVICLINLLLVWADLFNDMVRQHNWVETDLTSELFEENPYRCCEKVSCECVNAPSSAKSCNNMIENLEEGVCTDGYRCCEESCYECNCSTTCTSGKYGSSCTRSCSTCCSCDRSVSDEKCYSECGTCYKPTVTFSFEDEEQVTQFSKISTECGRDDTSCKDNFLDQYKPKGSTFPGYYNPYNKNQITEDISYPMVSLVFYIITSVIILTLFLGCLAHILYVTCKSYQTVKPAMNNVANKS